MNPELKKLADKVTETRLTFRESEKEFHQMCFTLVRKEGKVPDNHHIMLGSWDCSASPTGSCAYDMTDPDLSGDDECIFCGEPDERK